MENTLYLMIALPTPLNRLFEYRASKDLSDQLVPGVRIKVPFGKQILIGWLIYVHSQPTMQHHSLKEILAVIDRVPLFPTELYTLLQFAHHYYHHALGDILTHAVPAWLRKKTEACEITFQQAPSLIQARAAAICLNAAQQQVCDTILQSTAFQAFLLDGITGSGKTMVYMQLISAMLLSKKQVLLLVPEINLTPQLIQTFKRYFSIPIACLHSSMSERDRAIAWLQAREHAVAIVVGTRSAIFTPFKNLGVIIVDEEHDASFKQQERFRYHARDLAIIRGKHNQIPVVLGSATPSLESIQNTKQGRYQALFLKERAGSAALPNYEIINITSTPLTAGLSKPLLQAMEAHLSQNNQVMLFLNRRGFAPVLYCTTCQHIATCKHCDSRLVYHQKVEKLCCHHCDYQVTAKIHCTACQKTQFLPLGIGTERLEATLKKHFPAIPIFRLDRDSTKKRGATETLLKTIHHTEKAILIGTQMLAKGHHFPQVTLVGIIDADSGLFSADFRASEQTGQLIFQAAGRAGRAEKAGTVLVQTRYPTHPLIQTLVKNDYAAFAAHLLKEREQFMHPPFAYTASVRANAKTPERANQFLEAIKRYEPPDAKIALYGPIDALLAKKRGLYCRYLLIKTNHRQALQAYLKALQPALQETAKKHPVQWTLDVDPVVM